MQAIGELHWRWWQSASLPLLDWVSVWADSSSQRAVRFAEVVERVLEAYAGRLPDGAADLMRSLVAPFGQILDDLASAPATLIHSDLHLDNVYFMSEGEQTAAMIIDWQSLARGPAVLDVAGFLVESLSILDRRAHEVELLGEYHAWLSDAGVQGYDFERLFDDYLRALCVRIAGQFGWLARVIDDPRAGREGDLVDAILSPGKFLVALLENDAIERLARS